MKKKFGFWLMILFLVLAILSLVMYFVRQDDKIHADELIEKVSTSFKKDLKLFLENVDRTSKQIKSTALNFDVDQASNDDLNAYFAKLVQSEKSLYGVVLFGQDKNYVMIDDQKSLVITHNSFADSLVDWERYDYQLQKTGGWTEAYNQFMDANNFGSIKARELIEHDFIWRSSQSSIPERRNLLFTVFKVSDNSSDIAALIYKTSDLANRFNAVMQFNNPLVSVITNENSLVTPMRTTDTVQIVFFEGLSESVNKLLNTWKESGNGDPKSYTFSEKKQEYWCRIDTIKPEIGVSGFAITISNTDLEDLSKKVEEAFIYSTILFLLLALFAYLTSSGKFKWVRKNESLEIAELTAGELQTTISKGETEKVEFKSSLRWDYREEKVNKVLEDVILKSIAAFANAKGGTLMIGVSDDLDVLGLEPDFNTLKKQDVDFFELHLRKLINNQYSIRFSNKHILMQFPEISGKTICVIHIATSDAPLYLKTKGKQGQEIEKFYVRSGNASQEIASLKEINEYIKSHFKVGS